MSKQLLCTCMTLFSTLTSTTGRGHTKTKFSLLYLNMDKALKNSTPEKVAYIVATKFGRTQIHFFLVMFSLPSSSSLLKVSITTCPIQYTYRLSEETT